MSGVGTGLLWPRAVLSIPRAAAPAGAPTACAVFSNRLGPPPPPSPLVFLLPLSVTLPSRKTSAVRDKPTPAATPIFFFLLLLYLFFFCFSPLKVVLSKLRSSQTKKVRAGEKKEEGGDFAG